MKTRVLTLIVALILCVSLGAYGARLNPTAEATHAAVTAKTLADTPVSGVVLPAGTHSAIITIETAGMIISWTGSTPAAATHFTYPAGTVIDISQEPLLLRKMKFIEAASGAKLKVTYLTD